MSGVLMTVMSGLLMTGGTSDTGTFKIGTFLENLNTNAENWVNWIITIIGFAMLGFAAYKIAKGLISKKGDTNWIMVILLVLFGAILSISGTSALSNLGKEVNSAVKTMGSTIVFPFFR